MSEGVARPRPRNLDRRPGTSAGFRALALATTVATFLEIVLGGTVRATGSGEACPDWPTCHGRVIPPLSGHVLIEYSHRLTASLVSILVVLLAVAAVWFWRQPRYLRMLSGVALALLVLQVILGGITVLAKLPPQVVTAHLATATALLGVLTIVTLYAYRGRSTTRTSTDKRLGRAAMLAAGGTFLLILSGSYVVGSDAGLACHTWPLCNGQLVPTGGLADVDISFLHRIVALLVGVCVAGMLVVSWRLRAARRAVFWTATAALIVYVVQVLIGAGNVWFGLASGVQVAHLATAQALWVATTALTVIAVTRMPMAAAAAPDAPRRRLPAAPSPNRRPRFGDRVRSDGGPGGQTP